LEAKAEAPDVKRTILIAVFALLLCSQAFAAGWNKSLASAQKNAKTKNQLIFVDLFADWCGWCHRMEQEVFPSEAFQKVTDDMILLRLNTEDGADGSKLAQRFQVTTLPTFLVLTPDLGLAGVIRGYAPANEFSPKVSDIETQYAAFRKRVTDEPKYKTDYQKRLDLAREFTQRASYDQSELRLKRLIAEPKIPADIRDRAYYELAAAQFFQNNYVGATATIKKLNTMATKGEALERARLLQGDVYLRQGNTLAAVTEFRAFKTAFPSSAMIKNVDMMLQQLERQLASKTN
jgi:thioredoxin-related protein